MEQGHFFSNAAHTTVTQDPGQSVNVDLRTNEQNQWSLANGVGDTSALRDSAGGMAVTPTGDLIDGAPYYSQVFGLLHPEQVVLFLNADGRVILVGGTVAEDVAYAAKQAAAGGGDADLASARAAESVAAQQRILATVAAVVATAPTGQPSNPAGIPAQAPVKPSSDPVLTDRNGLATPVLIAGPSENGPVSSVPAGLPPLPMDVAYFATGGGTGLAVAPAGAGGVGADFGVRPAAPTPGLAPTSSAVAPGTNSPVNLVDPGVTKAAQDAAKAMTPLQKLGIAALIGFFLAHAL